MKDWQVIVVAVFAGAVCAVIVSVFLILAFYP